MRRTTIFMFSLALLLAACGGGDDVGATTTTTNDTGGEDPGTVVPPEVEPVEVILQITNEGGFEATTVASDPIPTYLLLSDGRLLVPGIITLEFPGPLMPPLQVIQLDEETVAELLELIDATGVPEVNDERIEDGINVADAPDTVVTYYDEYGAHRLAIYALGMGDSDDPRVEATENLLEALGTAATTGESLGDYQPERLAVMVSDSHDAESDEFAQVLDWPLPVPVADLPEAGTALLGCLVLEGAELDQVLPIFEDATETTFFEEDGTVYRLTPRPIFPGEEGCPL